MANLDAIVVGSGPNGLTAAITLARAGLYVHVFEAADTIGGGTRSASLTLPGFTHDVCSAIHPMGAASPAFLDMPLEQHGLEWITPPAALAHVFADRPPAMLENSVDATAAALGPDAANYRATVGAAAEIIRDIVKTRSMVSAGARNLLSIPRLGLDAMGSAARFVERNFRTTPARALIGGIAGHSMLPLETSATAAIALALGAAGNVVGWPFPRGGSQRIADALASYLRSLGGRITTGTRIEDLRELPAASLVLLDITPEQLLRMAGPLLPERFSRLLRAYRHAEAAFKVDYALSDPVPWRDPLVRRAATVHIGGTYEEIAHAERLPDQGRVAERPFILAAQHSLFDRTRAPEGRHTFWTYCHVPFGSDVDMLGRMETQIERFAPGFRDTIMERSVMPPSALEAHNPNLIGGDIVGGRQDLWQVLIRPTLRYWGTPLKGVYLCSAATPPGAGVHGMCGYFAAKAALASLNMRSDNS